VIAGEDAVNVIQQKTAVAPIVEVRDLNNLPVPGVAVTFTVSGQSASFGGLSTLTVTTNAAGQAAAAGLTPTAAGAVQINAAAVLQGQTAVATITQTNVLTAAQAAAAGSGSGAAAGSAAAGGGGGGISGTTLGLLGAAVGGGALAATQVGRGDEPQTAAAPTTTTSAFAGAYSGRGQTVNSATNPADFIACTETVEIAGTLTMNLERSSDGRVTGTATTTLRRTTIGLSSSCPASQLGRTSNTVWNLPVSGTAQSLNFDAQLPIVSALQPGTTTLKFAGRIDNNTVLGTVTWGERFGGLTAGTPALAFSAQGSASFDVTLR